MNQGTNLSILSVPGPQAPGLLSRARERAGAWLSCRCEFASRLLGCAVSNLAVAGSSAGGALLAVAVWLCSDDVCEYGWAACCGLLAWRCCAPLVREFKREGGAL